MKIVINNQETETAANNLLELTNELQLNPNGMAMAVNGQVVPRAQWADRALQPADKVVIIKAACGG